MPRLNGRRLSRRVADLLEPTQNHRTGYELTPCECGRTVRLVAAIPEPDGPICMNCRRDLSGIKWPVDPFDRYINLA